MSCARGRSTVLSPMEKFSVTGAEGETASMTGVEGVPAAILLVEAPVQPLEGGFDVAEVACELRGSGGCGTSSILKCVVLRIFLPPSVA